MPEAVDSVERWIICFTGFRQEGRQSGIETLQHELHRQCHCDTTRVLLKSWKDSMPDLAHRIWNRRPRNHPPKIVLIGYSYGGFTAVLLAREFETRELPVEVMLLIDPVWRPYPWFPSTLSMLKLWTIKVPWNVSVICAWHQKLTKPHGHKLIPSPRTLYYDRTLLKPHEEIDEDESIHKKALEVACPELAAQR